MTLKYKIYNVKNNGTNNNIFLGRASIKGYRQSNENKFIWHYNKNVKDTFVFSNLIGSKNLKLIAPTEELPTLQLDTRYYNFYNIDTINPATIFSNISTQNEQITVIFKSITTDGSVFIKQAKDDRFLWNGFTTIIDDSTSINNNTSCTDKTIRLLTPDYQLKDNIVPKKYESKSYSVIRSKTVNGSNIVLGIKKLAGSKCIQIKTTNNKLKFEFNKKDCPCGTVINSSSSSSSSSSESSSSSSSSNSSSSNSSSSNSSSSQSSSSSSERWSQSSQSSGLYSYSSLDSSLLPYPICDVNNLTQFKSAKVMNANDHCVPNGDYINTTLSPFIGEWTSIKDNNKKITLTRDQDTGNWIVKLTTNSYYVYETTVPYDNISCDKGYIEGLVVLNFNDPDESSSSSSLSLTSQSSLSSSEESNLQQVYQQFFGECVGPDCSSEYYCVQQIIKNWQCESGDSFELIESSESSESSSQSGNGGIYMNSFSSDSTSSSDTSSSSQLDFDCTESVIVIFG